MYQIPDSRTKLTNWGAASLNGKPDWAVECEASSGNSRREIQPDSGTEKMPTKYKIVCESRYPSAIAPTKLSTKGRFNRSNMIPPEESDAAVTQAAVKLMNALERFNKSTNSWGRLSEK